MAKFLDENGVKKLWSRIQEYVYECCCSKGGGKVIHIKDDGKGGYTCDTSCDDIERILKDGGYVAAYHNGSFYNLDNIVGGPDSTYIGFSRVDIKTRSSENQQVIKKEFVFSLNDCTIQYSDKRYPEYS